ncbi:hypothetical protein AS361_14855 [Myroides marinus]|uniref:putative phage abortive infection protein n=1 Tax=Myroides marinus TaxID=703342 RepID=UPI000741F6B9|nr:putative phage abortive infection protein [Myroides marinus]KUF45105.1 hypothetical protein AS361_14855 [Myroides marinus]
MGKDKKVKTYSNSIFYAFFLLVMVLILIVFVVLHFVTSGKAGEGYYELGGAVDGLTAPFIGISAAVLTFLAFRMQIDANNQVKEQFKLQQFESQFYELLRLHKENVNEMVIQGYVFEGINKIEREISGRKIFVSNINEINSLINIICKYRLHYLSTGQNFSDQHQDIIMLAYVIFFYGLDSIEKQCKKFKHPVTNKDLSAKEQQDLIALICFIREFRRNHYEKGKKKLVKSKVGISTSNVELNFNYKPFSGHLSRYGHYYRNLFLIVKHVVDNKIGLTYEEERNYLRILRAQLTSHEQFLLFLNWYCEIGSQWEEDDKKGNKFFTDYRMIHNINVDTVVENSYIDWEKIIRIEFENRLDFKYLNERGKELFEVIEGFISSQNKETK